MASHRVVGRPFPKGASPNPGGRPKGFEDIQARARDLCPLAIEKLGQILLRPKASDSAVIRAAELLLERGYGKAPAFHTNDPGEFRDVLEMTDAQIRDRLAVIRRAASSTASIRWRCPAREATAGSSSAEGWSPHPGGGQTTR